MLTNEQIAVMYGAAQDQNRTGIPPSVHLARAVEAATLATVTPLVSRMLEDLERWVPRNDISKTTPTIDAARAFLSGATKESNHG